MHTSCTSLGVGAVYKRSSEKDYQYKDTPPYQQPIHLPCREEAIE